MRDTALAETVQLKISRKRVLPAVPGAPKFEDMSADGSKVFFTDPGHLTKGSNASNSQPDLYMCEIIAQDENLTCALKDLSVARNVGEAGAVLGLN